MRDSLIQNSMKSIISGIKDVMNNDKEEFLLDKLFNIRVNK